MTTEEAIQYIENVINYIARRSGKDTLKVEIALRMALEALVEKKQREDDLR